MRLLELLLGITMMSLGVALTIHSGLGTTPISALSAALSPITGLTVGILTIIINAGYVVTQILLLRRRYPWIQLLQFVTGMMFALLIDVAMVFTAPLQTDNYVLQWVLAITGILIMGVGIGFQVHANLINLPGEGFVLALTAESRRVFGPRKVFNFGTIKTVTDLFNVLVAAIVGYAFLGRLEGVREATVLSAFALGTISRATLRLLPKRHSN